jgi:hypothetical protein
VPVFDGVDPTQLAKCAREGEQKSCAVPARVRPMR